MQCCALKQRAVTVLSLYLQSASPYPRKTGMEARDLGRVRLHGDPIPTYKQGDSQKYTFSGERINRGLYRSADGTLINADVNGGANIIRKEYPDAFNGQNLDYLWKTTKVVKYTDLYKGAKSTCKEKYNNKQHRTSPNSKIRHFYRKNTRLEYRMFWGKSKSA